MKKNLIFLLILCATKELLGFSIFISSTQNIAEFEYAAGMAQARIGNYKAAQRILEFGWLRNQNDSRFLSQLAGVSYRNGDRERAKDFLYRLLTVKPEDRYANEFLGTLFLLDGNMEASLKYWNRLGKPRIEQIELHPLPHVDPGLMDKAFVMAPASALTREDYLATELRLQMMGIFKKYDFRLRPHRNDGSFDLIVRPQLKKGMLASKIKMATLVAQGIFTETVKPEFHNIRGTTISSTSLISWDEYKNRFYSSLSLPFGNDPHSRIRLFTDTRHETWSLGSDVELLKWEGGLEFGESFNSRLKWNSGAKVSYRGYENVSTNRTQFFQEGWLVQTFGNTDFSLLRVPERRWTLKSITTGEVGKFFAGTAFMTLEHSLDMRWFPRAVGDDLAMTARFRTGKLFASAPFDEYFVLGIERDTDLLLRAHKSNIDKKGANPFAPGYLLWNWDFTKNLLDTSKFRWRLVPFVDVARIMGSDLWNGNHWFVDTGIQSGFQILGATELMLTYGKDLRTGRNVFYFSAKL